MEGWRQRRLGSMGIIWKKKKQGGREKKRTISLDTYRPSHGRKKKKREKMKERS
jgi:hypothetical protein